MPNPFQQRARTRKLVYTGLIVALFTASLIHRRAVIEPQAEAMQLREVGKGEVELTFSALRHMLIGSRGLAVTLLWDAAIQKQERHEWNEMELLVASVTKLQPYFITPWLYQSWNLSFNVAVEWDLPRDKYYYISRGLDMLAEGERRNHGGTLEGDPRKPRFPGSPELRFFMGFYYQLKIGSSDEKNVMRSLLDMSCIDPVERDPEELWPETSLTVNAQKFVKFCQDHPRLVRRLKEKLDYPTPGSVIKFLRENRDVPSRFEPVVGRRDRSPLKEPPERQFPCLPRAQDDTWPNPENYVLTHESVDVFLIARTWYQYAQLPLPPPDPDFTPEGQRYDKLKYRMPKTMSSYIFRNYPARAQAFIAEKMQEEGWFDSDGWVIKDWKELGDPFAVGTDAKYHSRLAWERAYHAYKDYGLKTGLYITPTERAALEAKVKFIADKIDKRTGKLDLRPEERNERIMEGARAMDKLRQSEQHRNTTNFEAHLAQTEAEATRQLVFARKLLFLAEDARRQKDRAAAEEYYEQTWPILIDVMLAHPKFAHYGPMQDEFADAMLAALGNQQKLRGDFFKPVMIGMAQLHSASVAPMLWAQAPIPLLLDQDLLPDTVKNRIILVPAVRGILDEMIYYDAREPRTLKEFLVGWTSATNPYIRLPNPNLVNLTLSNAVMETTSVARPWRVLMESEARRGARERAGLSKPKIK